MGETRNGDRDSIVPEHLPELVKKIAKKEGYKNPNITIKPISSGGANYMSFLFTITVTEDGQSDLDLFVKFTNTPPALRSMVQTKEVFEREIFSLTTLADAFAKLQEKHNIPENERFRFPKLYGSSLVDLEEAIVMPNMTSRGYIVYDRFKSMDWEYASAAIKELAKYHALGYVFAQDDPEMFERTVKSKEEMFHKNQHFSIEMRQKHMEKIIGASLNVLEGKRREKLEKFGRKMYDPNFIKRHVQPTVRSALAHGDFRMSNILVKYHKEKVVSLIPIDYQIIYHGNPLNDLMYFIFTGSDMIFRKNHYEDLVQLYYDSLASFLRKFDMNVEDVYPESEFRFDMKDKLEYGLFFALFVLPILTVSADDAPTLEDMMEVDRPAVREGNTLFVERLHGLIDDFSTWGVL